MSFFSQDFLEFFKELAANNNKDWFDANRKRYEKNIKDTFKTFVEKVINDLKKIEPEMAVEAKDVIFRINRDIRFSKDKSPYKLHASAHVSKFGKKVTSVGGIYFEFGPEKMAIASGIYEAEKETIADIRNHIANNMERFSKLIAEKNFIETFGEIKGEKAKRLDKELQSAADLQPLIYNKQWYYWVEFKPETILQKDLVDILLHHYKTAKALNDFFAEALA